MQLHEVPGFADRLLVSMESADVPRCARANSLEVLACLRGPSFAHVVESVAVQLMRALGLAAAPGQTVNLGNPELFLITVQYRCEEGARFLLKVAVEFVQAVAENTPYPLAGRLADARRIFDTSTPGPSTTAIINAARSRFIPVQQVDAKSGLVRLGYGKHSRWVKAATSTNTSTIACDIAEDKDLTKHLLSQAGIPVPCGRVVDTVEDALEAWREIGSAVVVKPLDGNQGRGVSLNLDTPEDIQRGFEAARHCSSKVIVERLVEGRDYRVLIVGGRMIAASEKSPAQVQGDGVRTIGELVAQANTDPRRGGHHSKPLSFISIDSVVEACLQRQHLSLDSVPEAGRQVVLRESANLSTGGEATDVTDAVHPDFSGMCERAARVVGLDICGVDLVAPDISRPFEGRGGIVELNAAPGLRMHEFPSRGRPRDAGGAIVEMLYPNHATGRIPVVSVTGGKGKTTSTRMIDHVLQSVGTRTGMFTADGVRMGGPLLTRANGAAACSASAVLSDLSVDVAVLETKLTDILHSGLAYDWSDVGVYTDLPAYDRDDESISGGDQTLRGRRLVAERVRSGGTLVMNADDSEVMDIAEHAAATGPRRELVLFSLRSTCAAILRHVNAGGTAFVLHGEWLEARRPEGARRIVRSTAMPSTFSGAADFHIANALAAAAACSALGVTDNEIAAGLMSFDAAAESSSPVDIYGINGSVLVVAQGADTSTLTEVSRRMAYWRTVPKAFVIAPPLRQPGEVIAALQDATTGFNGVAKAVRSQYPAADVRAVADDFECVRVAARSVDVGQVAVALCHRQDTVHELLRELGGVPLSNPEDVFSASAEHMRIPA
jgi:cyanophycin synthetase